MENTNCFFGCDGANPIAVIVDSGHYDRRVMNLIKPPAKYEMCLFCAEKFIKNDPSAFITDIISKNAEYNMDYH